MLLSAFFLRRVISRGFATVPLPPGTRYLGYGQRAVEPAVSLSVSAPKASADIVPRRAFCENIMRTARIWAELVRVFARRQKPESKRIVGCFQSRSRPFVLNFCSRLMHMGRVSRRGSGRSFSKSVGFQEGFNCLFSTSAFFSRRN